VRTSSLFALLALSAILAVPAFAGAPATDGTLSVKDAKGMVQLSSRGSLIARFERGKVTITDPNPYDARKPTVFGADAIVYRNAKTTVYSGKGVRIRIGGGMTHVRIEGRGIYLSAVGRGTGMIEGAGSAPAGVFYDGVWSLNDEDYRSLPDEPTRFQLAALRPGA
jgi:hypothetical protein